MKRSAVAVIDVPVERNELIECCPPSLAKALMASGRRRWFRPGAPIFDEQDAATHVCLLEAGSVVLFRQSPEARRFIVRIVAPGESFGLPSVIAASGRTVGAEAIASSAIFEIPAQEINSAMRADPSMAAKIASLAVREYASLLDFIEGVFLKPVTVRILELLLKLEAERAEGDVLRLRQRLLAEMAATTRETFTAQLGILERGGFVTRVGRGIRLRNRELARELVEHPTLMHLRKADDGT